MGTLAGSPPTDRAQACDLTSLPIDDRRGIQGMLCVILTEMSLFVCLFSAYFYLGIDKNRWAADQPPKLMYALIMLVVLLSSSAVLEWGERQVSRQRYGAARIALILTIGIGLVFMVLQGLEYQDHWKTLTPYSDSYGSIFLRFDDLSCGPRHRRIDASLLRGFSSAVWSARGTFSALQGGFALLALR